MSRIHSIWLSIWLGLVLTAGLFQPAAHAGPGVAASIKPVHALVSTVMQGIGQPELIIAGNASPHDLALKPSQRRMLGAASIIFHIGGGLERSLVKPLDRAKADGAIIVALIEAPGIALLPIRESAIWPSNEPAHGDEHGVHDPHIWLDPHNAAAMAQHIADVLANADPDNAAAYRSNARRFASKIDQLQADIAARLAPVRAIPFIVFHDGYQYFEKRFGLNAAGAIAADPDKRPGARRLRDIRATIAERKASCVFAEPQFDVSYVAIVMEGSSARSAQLDPIGALPDSGKNAYITLMTDMAEKIAQCLGDGP